MELGAGRPAPVDVNLETTLVAVVLLDAATLQFLRQKSGFQHLRIDKLIVHPFSLLCKSGRSRWWPPVGHDRT